MQVSKRAAVATLATAALAGSSISAVSALADHGGGGNGNHGRHHGRTVLGSTLAPSVPADPMIHGVAAGGAPWVLTRGDVRLRADGRLRANIRGLVIPPPTGNGTTGPVTTVKASLYCGADSTAAVGSTASVPITPAGNARIDGQVALPAKCLAPVVLINPNGSSTVYIAGSGF
jgi:hypothetical protein